MLRKKTTTTIPEEEVGLLFIRQGGEAICPICNKAFDVPDGHSICQMSARKPICMRCVRRDFGFMADPSIMLQRAWSAVKMARALAEASARRTDEAGRMAREEEEAAKAAEERRKVENCDCDKCVAERAAASAPVTTVPRLPYRM